MTPQIYKTETLEPKRVRELYTVTRGTMFYDRLRSCWICGGKFKIGDGMTILGGTQRGNQAVHSRCYTEQTDTIPKRVQVAITVERKHD